MILLFKSLNHSAVNPNQHFLPRLHVFYHQKIANVYSLKKTEMQKKENVRKVDVQHMVGSSEKDLKVHKHEIFFWLFLQKPKPYGPKGL